MLAVQAEGDKVVTVEGLSNDETLTPLQASFRKHHALQCGFCTPGMITTSHALLTEDPNCDADRVREVLSGNCAAAPATSRSWKPCSTPAAPTGARSENGQHADRPAHRAHRGPAAPARQGHLRRRHRAREHAACRGGPQPGRPWPIEGHRHEGRAGAARRACGDHRQGPRRRDAARSPCACSRCHSSSFSGSRCWRTRRSAMSASPWR